MYQYTESGLTDVWLENGYAIRETSEGPGVSIKAREELHKTIALALCESKNDLTGRHFRFLRVELGLSQKRLAESLKITDQTVANWEKGKHEVSRAAAMVLQNLYLESSEKESNLTETIQRLNELDHEIGELGRKDNQLAFVMSEDDHWISAAA